MTAAPTIGIDARKLHDGGIGRYLQGLLGALAAGDGPERYVLFVPVEDPAALPEPLGAQLAPDRFRLVRCAAGLYSLSELFAFRHAAGRYGLHLLHFPHYVRSLDPGCPIAVTIHDAIHLSHPPSLPAAVYARAMLTWSARTAAAVFTPTEAARLDIARRLSVPAGRFRVTPNGVDSRLFSPPGFDEMESFRRSRDLGRDYVLCLGTHRPHKNLPMAVAAFAAAGLEDAEMLIPAPDEREAVRLAACVRPSVRVLPGVRDADLPLLYAGARVVLAPSLAEGFGLAPLEAAACGAAVLATDIPAHREVLGDAVAWFAASSGTAGLAESLRSVWRDDAQRERLRRRGPERARRFDWATTARLTREGYRAARSTSLRA